MVISIPLLLPLPLQQNPHNLIILLEGSHVTGLRKLSFLHAATLGLDGGSGSIDIFGNITTTVRQEEQAMYLPWRGLYFTIWLAGSKQTLVISATESCSW